MSVSSAQLAANHANAQHSTGPRSAEGKAASSANSFRHGLTSRQIVLPQEDAREFESVRQSMLTSNRPANAIETALVDEMAQSWWRRQRALAAETAFLAKHITDLQKAEPGIDADTATALAMATAAKSGGLNLILRYVTQADRAFNRAQAQLKKLQEQRRHEEYERRMLEAGARVHEERKRSGDERNHSNGFVSHSHPAPVPPSVVVIPPAFPAPAHVSLDTSFVTRSGRASAQPSPARR